MCEDLIQYTPIGIIRTPYSTVQGMPIQNVNARGIQGRIEIKEEYRDGLQDLNGFSHLILLYHFNLIKKVNLKPLPFLDGTRHGLFSTRAPSRVNPLGFSVVRFISLSDLVITVQDVDILDRTPVLDIKPYIPAFDAVTDATIGWYTDRIKKMAETSADDRFTKE